MRCLCCLHRDRDALDTQIVQGVSYRVICRAFGVSLGALSRHRKHVKEAIRALSPAEIREHGGELLARVQEVVDEAKTIVKTAMGEKHFGTANAALNTILRSLELIGKVTGELQTNPSGIRLTQIDVTRTYTEAAIDAELAGLIAEATDNFNPARIEEFRALRAIRVQHHS
jgi:hypothetical protein